MLGSAMRRLAVANKPRPGDTLPLHHLRPRHLSLSQRPSQPARRDRLVHLLEPGLAQLEVRRVCHLASESKQDMEGGDVRNAQEGMRGQAKPVQGARRLQGGQRGKYGLWLECGLAGGPSRVCRAYGSATRSSRLGQTYKVAT